MLTLFAYLQQGNVKKSKKLIKIVNTGEENLHIFQMKDLENFWKNRRGRGEQIDSFLTPTFEKLSIDMRNIPTDDIISRQLPCRLFLRIFTLRKSTNIVS